MDELASLIGRAHADMRDYQRRLQRNPASAQITLAQLPHALVPTHVVTRDLPRVLDELLEAGDAPRVMYRLGYLIGRTQAAAFFQDAAIDTTDLLYRVLAGPFHLAWAGYGDVDLLVLEPHLDDRFALLWSPTTRVALERPRMSSTEPAPATSRPDTRPAGAPRRRNSPSRPASWHAEPRASSTAGS